MGKKSTASASLGTLPEAVETTTETAAASSLGAEGTPPTVGTSTAEGDTVDLEAAMLSQGDDNDDVYGKRYLTTPEDRTGRSAAKGETKSGSGKKKRNKNVKHCNMLRRSYRKR